MNNYFRLLFAAAIMFIMVGLSQGDRGGALTQSSLTGTIAVVDQPCLPPSNAGIPSYSFLPEVPISLEAEYPFEPVQSEYERSKRQSWLPCNALEFNDRKQSMHEKTGLFLHLKLTKEDPALL